MISRETAEHYTWGEGCDGWHLVKTPELSVIQERMPPGTSEVRHQHRRARQFFFALSGTATLEIAGTRHTLAPGTGAEVPPGTPHQMMNLSDAPIEFLVVSQPPTTGDRVMADLSPNPSPRWGGGVKYRLYPLPRVGGRARANASTAAANATGCSK